VPQAHTVSPVFHAAKYRLMKPSNFLVVLCFGLPQTGARDVPAPNIILMMADDMGIGDTSAYQDFTGNSDEDQIHTPAMERLAKMGVRFTDAHTPSSRCSPTRYGLLTGRYPWRNRLKHWVLFGSQGDPMIEADRPTIASMLRDNGYHTGMVGKWHVGLRYRQSNGQPAAGFEDADLLQPLADGPMDHGFDFCRFTSRSHGTSGPEPGRKNKPNQNVGPGHVHGRTAIGATANGRQIAGEGPEAYVLKELGGRHSDDAMEFLNGHVTDASTKDSPFFLYYPSNSNHGPHTPDSHVGDNPVAGAARNITGKPMDVRSDYIYENDVALGRLLDWLGATDDPRNVGHKLIHNSIVIFTSDNGAEKNSNIATGPFRSHKGSCYEGGHRVPFIVSWPHGRVGDGNADTPGRDSQQLIGLTDVYATFADAVHAELPNNAAGEKGAEDSLSMLSAWQGVALTIRPLFFNDHKEAKQDPAVAALRLDNPSVGGTDFPGQWKIFFDARLLRRGEPHPTELYDLSTDSIEENNRVSEPALQPVVAHLSAVAMRHRTAGGHRLAAAAASQRITFNWQDDAALVDGSISVADQFHDAPTAVVTVAADLIKMTVTGVGNDESFRGKFALNSRGLGLSSGRVEQVDDGEALLISFDRDVIVESASIVAGNGVCGGFYRVGENSPLAIYCIDADIDAKDQSGILSDIGVVKAGQKLRLDSSPHFGVEAKGCWRLQTLTVRLLK
jgi:arylsulfatase A